MTIADSKIISIGEKINNPPLIVSFLDPASGFTDSPLSQINLMKSFSILTLTLALGLFVGCSPKENQPSATMNTDSKSDPGEIFLAANAKKEGVTTTASGLQYKVIKSGTGASPKATDQVKVHYTGTTIDGNVFDSSVQRGQPAVFPVNAVIPGWVEALQLMKAGDKWQLFIPARLAYGDRSPGAAIPANSVLIFEVELLDIEK
jgi:FKBP-type peptidyl-prolyl cis-trans isomerase